MQYLSSIKGGFFDLIISANKQSPYRVPAAESLGDYTGKMDVDFPFCLLRGNVTKIECRLFLRNMPPSFHPCFSVYKYSKYPHKQKKEVKIPLVMGCYPNSNFQLILILISNQQSS